MREKRTGIRKSIFTAAVSCLLALSLAGCGVADMDESAAIGEEQNAVTSEQVSSAAAEQADGGLSTRGKMVGETYADVCNQDGVDDGIRIWLTHLNEESELPEHAYNVDVVNYLTAYPSEYIFLEVLPGAMTGEETTYAETPAYEAMIGSSEEEARTIGLINRDGQDYLIEYRHYLAQGIGIYGYEIFWLDGDIEGENLVTAEECKYTYDLNMLNQTELASLTEVGQFAEYLSAAEMERVTAALNEIMPEVTVLAQGTGNPASCSVLCGTETVFASEIFFRGVSGAYEDEKDYVQKNVLQWLGTQLAENPNLWETAGDGVVVQPDEEWELTFTVWDDLLGYDHVLSVHSEHSYLSDYGFYVEDSGTMREIASAWGSSDEDIYPVDQDGDGSAELLICGVTYYADGGGRLVLYRTAEDGTAQEANGEDLIDIEYFAEYGVRSIYAEYLTDTQTIRVYYWQDSINDFAYRDYPMAEHYDRLEWYECSFG